MQKLILFSFVLFAFGSISFAESLPDSALTTAWEKETFKATLKPGYHFNLEAPNQLTVDGVGVKPASAQGKEIVFKSPQATYQHARVSLFVCDDALTFCQPKTLEYGSPTASSSAPTPATSTTTSAPKTETTPKAVVKNDFGFIADNWPAALSQARLEKKLVLLDVSARWCPGCVRLENEVFDTKDFKKAARDFVTVRLDYDRFENQDVTRLYNIHVIPTLLVANAKGDEISRSVDFQPLAVTLKFLKEAQKNPLSFAELETKAQAGDKAAILNLGRRLYAGFQFSRAVTFLEQVKPTPVELADARVQAAKEAAKNGGAHEKEAFQKTVREAIRSEPSSSRSLNWRSALAETLEPGSAERKSLGEEGLKVGDAILAHPAKLREALRGDAIGEFAGFEKLFVASERADLAEAAGLDEATQQAARLKVTEIGREMKIPVSRKGPSLRYLIFLMAAHQFPEAETQVRAMLKADPSNPELSRRLLKILNGEAKYEGAIRVGRETLTQSFGKNEVWVAQQLAKAYIGNGQKLEAQALAKAYLARADIDWTLMKSEQKDFQEMAASKK